MDTIYHVALLSDWEKAKEMGYYEASSLTLEGFIHCSTESQVAGVLQRYFGGKGPLVKLVIDPARLTAPLKYELAPSVNEEFPHIYGPLNLAAVVEVVAL